MDVLGVYKGINELNNMKFKNIVNSTYSFVFGESLDNADYDFVKNVDTIINEQKQEYPNFGVQSKKMENLIKGVFSKYSCKYNSGEIERIGSYLEEVNSKYVLPETVFRNMFIKMMYWLYKYEDMRYSKYSMVIFNGDILDKYSILFADMSALLGSKVIVIFGDRDLKEIDTYAEAFKSNMKKCEQLENKTDEFHSVFEGASTIACEKKDSRGASLHASGLVVNPYKTVMDTYDTDIPTFKVIVQTKKNIKEDYEIELALESKSRVAVFVFGHKEDRAESNNEFVKYRRLLGEQKCDLVQDKLDNLSRTSNEHIHNISDGFDRFSQFELREMADKNSVITSTGKTEVRRTAYELSSKIRREFREPFRYTIEKSFLTGEVSISKLYNVSIMLGAMINSFNIDELGVDTILYFKTKELSTSETLFFRTLTFGNSLIFVDWSKESEGIITEDIRDNVDIVNFDCAEFVTEVPRDSIKTKIKTMASRAQAEIEGMMYNNEVMGVYKSNQFKENNTIVLSTTLDEISILWDVEMKVRQGFEASDRGVVIPTLFANIVGVGELSDIEYSRKIKELLVSHTMFKCNSHFNETTDISLEGRSIKNDTNEFNVNTPSLVVNTEYETVDILISNINQYKLVSREAIKKNWKYNIICDEKQELMLDKIAEMLSDISTKTGEITPYHIANAIARLPDEIVNDIVWFDFTKKSPKIVMLFTTDNIMSIWDCVTVWFCNLIGFDIAIFVPTCYKGLDGFLDKSIYEMYLMGSPSMSVKYVDTKIAERKGVGFFSRLFS